MAKVKKERRSFIVVFFVVVLCACFAISLFSIVKDINDVKEEIAAVEVVKEEKEAENEAYRDKINAGDKDEYVEEIARDKLGYVMPGERVYQDISVND